jgi:methionyl aminopeptidase
VILLKGPDELAQMREAGRIVAEVLDEVEKAVRAGVTTDELDRLAEELTLSKGAKPAFKGYKPHGLAYPKSLCVSINEEIVHGIPSARRIKPGDIVSLDFGVNYMGYFADSARTVPVGRIGRRDQRLIEVTRAALYAGIEQARTGNRLSDIATAVQRVAETAGFSVVEEFAGHGIGRSLHEEPQVPNYFRPGMENPRLKEGMALAIEPMFNEGGPELKILANGWTAVTADGKRSAHFEHCIAICGDGPEILSVARRV